MRVLLIDNSPQMGGSIHSAATLLRGLSSLGVQTGLVASRPDLFASLLGEETTRLPIEWDGFRNVFDPAHGLSGGGLPFLGQTLALRRFGKRIGPEIKRAIEDFGPDLVHVNNLNLPNLPVIVAVRDTASPVTLHVRMIREFSRRELLPLDRAAWVLCISEAVKRLLLERSSVPAERFVVVPNGVDVDAFDTAPNTELRRELGLPVEAPVALLVGRLTTWKGQHVAIAAWQRVVARHPNAVLALAGEGGAGYTENLQKLAAHLGLADAIHFLGQRGDIPRVMAAADLVVHASCFSDPAEGTVEAFGRVVIEAMAAGRPVVATRTGGVPELVRDGVTGHLAAPNDPEDLARRIVAAFDDADWRAKAGAAGRREVEQTYGQAVVARRVLDLFERAVASARGE
ncbi:MAG: glycosyltransferase family 4 protein [Candidatus Lernaella stagnicola]|nr:glycosyltransferase family 4 protein [Candidatus Lernaella stagnicola]